MAAVLEITDTNFETEVIGSATPVLVDFGATWCGPCKQLAPIVELLAKEYEGRLKVTVVDIDKARETAMRYGIMSVPTIMFFKGGEVRESLVGFRTKAALEDHISRVLA